MRKVITKELKIGLDTDNKLDEIINDKEIFKKDTKTEADADRQLSELVGLGDGPGPIIF